MAVSRFVCAESLLCGASLVLSLLAACGSDPDSHALARSRDAGSDSSFDAGGSAGQQASTDAGGDAQPDTPQPVDPCNGSCQAGQACLPPGTCATCASPKDCPQLILYVASDGTGEACSYALPCAFDEAHKQVRARNAAMTGELHVVLRSGRYVRADTWSLDALDSGSGGFDVVWRAWPGEQVVISGGVRVQGPWKLVDAATNIHRAEVGTTFGRHLFVDGRRAVRARSGNGPSGFTETATGYTSSAISFGTWAYPKQVELVGYKYWRSFRCPIASVSGATVTMAQPCWANAQASKGDGYDYTLDLPRWVENAPELLNDADEFFFDKSEGRLDYIPRPGIDPNAADVVVPVLEKLVHIAGTLDEPVHHLRLEGLTFAEATWTGPSTDDGYVEVQGGIVRVGDQKKMMKTPAAVSVEAGHDLALTGCTFTRLGGAGLSIAEGSHDVLVQGNRFEDISGGAILVGDVSEPRHHHPTDPRTIVANNTIRNNFVTRIGREHPSAVGIFAGYTEGTRIEHNDLFDLPYTAISVGWGWGSVDVGGSLGYTTPASSRDNHLLGNRAAYYMRELEDGGGVYTLGAQAGSSETGNYLSNQGSPYAAIYLDNGTQHYTVTGNVVEKTPHWLLCQTFSTNAMNNVVQGNWTELDNPFTASPHPSNAISGNAVTGGNWPKAALDTIAASGLGESWRQLHPDDVARGKPAQASSVWDASHTAGKAVDGEGKNGWSPAASTSDPNPWWQVDLQQPARIAKVEVVMRWELDQPSTRQGLDIVASNDASFATSEVLAELDDAGLPHRAIWAAQVSNPGLWRYVRIRKPKGGYMYLGEVRVLAQP